MKLNKEIFRNQALHCIWTGWSRQIDWDDFYYLRDRFQQALDETLLQKIHFTKISMIKNKCITTETMEEYHQGKHYLKKSIGDKLEEFMSASEFFI